MTDETLVAPVETEAASSPADVSIPTESTEQSVETPVEEPIESTSEQSPPEEEQAPDKQEGEEDLSEFTGSVSARIREMIKRAPELGATLQKHPEIQKAIAFSFRREAGYREAWPTVAEAQQVREYFPRGLEDVQQLISEVEEVGQQDSLFYSRDPEQQGQLVRNMYQSDPRATESLLENLPRVWAEISPASYQKTFQSIISSTFSENGMFALANDIKTLRDSGKAQEAGAAFDELLKLLDGYAPSNGSRRRDPEREKLDRDTKEFEAKRQKDEEGKKQTFTQNLAKAEIESATGDIKAALGNRLPKTLPPAKAEKIISEIRTRTFRFIAKSRPFMNARQSAMDTGDIQKAVTISQTAWKRVLPMMIRKVLSEETPTIVQGTRTANDKKRQAASRTEPGSSAAPRDGTSPSRTAGPRKVNGQFVDANGRPYSTEDVLRGKHLQ
jgi:hypothetical protein